MNEDRGARYHRLKRRASVLSAGTCAAFFALLSATGWGASWPLVLFVALIALGTDLVTFPISAYGRFFLDRKYGLSSASFMTWLADELKGMALGLAIWELAVFGLYALMRWAGQAWWLAAAGVFAVVLLALSWIGPVLLMPIFDRVRPLQREALRDRLLSLSRKAGIQVLDAFEWTPGEKTTRANAGLAGVGRSRRILVSERLLDGCSDDEIEVILAHEIAHHVHHDVATALGVETGIVAAALLTAHLGVTAAGYAATDRAALPLMFLIGGAVVLLLTPIAKAWSRHSERRADRFALDLTGRHDAFISAMRRLAAHNLAEMDPSRAALWFFHTHPTIEERIAVAREFKAAEA